MIEQDANHRSQKSQFCNNIFLSQGGRKGVRTRSKIILQVGARECKIESWSFVLVGVGECNIGS